MDTATLISKVIDTYDHVSGADSDNSARQAKILQYAQEVVEEVWYHREWAWRYKASSIAVSGNGADLPGDFHSFGENGGLYTQTGYKLQENHGALVFGESYSDNSSYPIFAIYGQNEITGAKSLFVSSGQDLTLDIAYLRVAPTLVNDYFDNGQLQFIPVAYHNTVILPGVVYKLKHQQEGEDQRDWYMRYQQGLSRMAAMERDLKTAVQQIPLTVAMW